MLVETIDTSDPQLQELFGCEVIVVEKKETSNLLVGNSGPYFPPVEDYTKYVEIYNSYSYQVNTAIKQFDEILRMQCMCANHSGVVYDASFGNFSNVLNISSLQEDTHDHEHGHCPLHPHAHFKKGEKCPLCSGS